MKKNNGGAITAIASEGSVAAVPLDHRDPQRERAPEELVAILTS